ncbi:MAG: hypothetical protein KF841_10775 [Phycisphaerae bacterium]|nr:hypothetical protein [Phycisphaerae bacterium]
MPKRGERRYKSHREPPCSIRWSPYTQHIGSGGVTSTASYLAGMGFDDGTANGPFHYIID